MTETIKLFFCGMRAWIEIYANCAGLSGIAGVGSLPFVAPTSDNHTLLGSPFMPNCPDLGYPDHIRHIANAEHESIHYKLCETLFDAVSPNHRVLIIDPHDDTTIEPWRHIEEQLVTGVQFYMNRGEIPATIIPFFRGASAMERYRMFFSVVGWAEELRKRLLTELTECEKLTGDNKRKC